MKETNISTAVLYIVGTPIGNLEDITLRAIRILKEVDLILCEDTRMTKRLLDKYGINTPTESYHARSTESKTAAILEFLEKGKRLALVSDAGTPGISDPGSLLVGAVRKHFATKTSVESSVESTVDHNAASIGGGGIVTIVPIPGPSAMTATLSASGLPTAQFTFLGFLPHKKGRQTLFKEIALSDRTMIFYESPHRIIKTLESLSEVLAEERKIVVARELTKVFEEIIFMGAKQALEYFNMHPDKVRGEFTVAVSPATFV